MKTKELIRQLQEADPSGEIECCIDNIDIYHLEVKEAYWDGVLQVLKRDESKRPCYDIVGAKITTQGSKLNIGTYSIEDLLLDNPEAPVEVQDRFVSQKLQGAVDGWRTQAKEITEKVERGMSGKKRRL